MSVTASGLARAIYRLAPDGCNWWTLPDGCESLSLDGWVLRVINDPGDDAPDGLSWWLDSPVERGVESGGWEMLPAADLDREAGVLAEMLRRRAEVSA